MADVKYSDEKKLMTSDEFIAAAKEKADENLKIQKDLAKDIYDSSYASLENAYMDTEATAATARDRNIINADTEYKLSEMKYGAAEEALAGSGLSGSGLSEYQRAQAYAKSRDEKQASYAEYDKIMREAAYNRDQGKLSADIKYKQDVADATIGYNNTMTSLGEKELGYDTLEKQAIDSSYNGYIDGINKGTMTLDQIKNDSYWSKLSPEQQKAVETASAVKGYKTRIDNGESIEDIMGSYGYADLSSDAQNEIQGYYASVQAGKTSDANAALGSYLEMATTGMSIDSIVAMATANGHYDVLRESGAWDSVTREAEKITKQNATNETLANIEDAIANGATLEEIQNMPGYDELDDTDKLNIEQAVIDRDEEKEVSIDSVVANLFVPGNEVYSLDGLDTAMRAERVPPEMREEIISRWQSENTDRALAGIEDGSLFENTDPVTFAENIKNGVYGNNGQRVAIEYAKVLEASIQDDDADIVDFAQASYSFDQIKQYLPTAIKNRWSTAKGNRLKIDSSFAMSNDSKIGGNPVKAGDRITDETTVAALNQYNTNSKSQIITVGKNTYYRDGDSWSLVVDDYTREKSIYPPDLENAVVSQSKVVNHTYTIDGAEMKTKETDKRTVQLLEEHFGTKAGTLVKINGRFYVCLARGSWRFAYKK